MDIAWHRVILVVPAQYLGEPLPDLGDRLIDALSQGQLEFSQLGPDFLACAVAQDTEPSVPGCATDVRESQEREGFRFRRPAVPPIAGGEAAEFEQAGLLRVEFQVKARQPFT